MRKLSKNVSICIAVFFAVALFGIQAYASGVGGFSFELPPTSQGQGTGNDSAGQKLEGTVIINWSNYDAGTGLADARIMAELKHGNDSNTFLGEIVGFDVIWYLLEDPASLKDVIGDSLFDANGNTVLGYFFGDNTLEVTLISVELEYTEVGDFSDGSHLVLAHVIAAVK